MHKLIVTLKQHTPLIHFQHDQEGATLRISDVKPRLDKFILGKLSKEEREKGEREGWIKVKDGRACLSYQMVAASEGKTFSKELKIINATRIALMYEKTKITIFSNHEFVIEKMEDLLPVFFVINNFGYRQSKGYGSYTVTDLSLDGEKVAVPNIEISNVLCSNYFNTICLLRNVDDDLCFRRFEFNPKSYCKIPRNSNVRLFPLQYEFQNDEIPSPFNEMKPSAEDNIKKMIECDVNEKVSDSQLARNLIKQICDTNFLALKKDYQYNYFSVLFGKIIDLYYQKYKQGTREDRRNRISYDKAGIWHFFDRLSNNRGIVYWEKRAIKQRINRLRDSERQYYVLKNNHTRVPYNETHTPDSENQSYFYIRALLGLAETFEFQTNDKYVKFEVKINGIGEETDKAERAQSAIIFKVIENNVYVCLRKPEEVAKILNKGFSLSMNIVRNFQGTRQRLNERSISLGEISTNLPSTFSIENLYNDIVEYYQNLGYNSIRFDEQ